MIHGRIGRRGQKGHVDRRLIRGGNTHVHRKRHIVESCGIRTTLLRHVFRSLHIQVYAQGTVRFFRSAFQLKIVAAINRNGLDVGKRLSVREEFFHRQEAFVRQIILNRLSFVIGGEGNRFRCEIDARCCPDGFELRNVNGIFRMRGITAVEHALPLPAGHVGVFQIVKEQEISGFHLCVGHIIETVDVYAVLLHVGCRAKTVVFNGAHTLGSAV